MLIHIAEDERYPDYFEVERDSPMKDGTISLTEEELLEWTRVTREYDRWQVKIAKLLGRER